MLDNRTIKNLTILWLFILQLLSFSEQGQSLHPHGQRSTGEDGSGVGVGRPPRGLHPCAHRRSQYIDYRPLPSEQEASAGGRGLRTSSQR